MRKWSVRELESIEEDLFTLHGVSEEYAHIEDFTWLDTPEDCKWLAERITIRASHGERVMGQCDGCPEGYSSVVTCVDEYPDDMGAPSTLGVSYLCGYHVRDDYGY